MNEVTLFGLKLPEFLAGVQWETYLRIGLLLFFGLPFVFAISRWVRKYVAKHYSPQYGMIGAKVVHYGGVLLILFTLFHELGFSLAPLLGAAGIVGVALGFASQTSVSNIISGIFLVAEQPFVVGDVIKVGETVGVVLSIDVLSVKLRMFDNKYVRIPNETIIKSQVVNFTHFPIRRFDLRVSVAYKEDLARVKEALFDVAHKNPLALQEPAPVCIVDNFGASGIDLLFVVWTSKDDFLDLKNSLQEQIKARFDQDGIEIPFPHVSLYSGAASKPLQVELSGAILSR